MMHAKRIKHIIPETMRGNNLSVLNGRRGGFRHYFQVGISFYTSSGAAMRTLHETLVYHDEPQSSYDRSSPRRDFIAATSGYQG